MKRIDQYALTKSVISDNVKLAMGDPVDLAYLSAVSLSLVEILADLSDVEFQKFMFAMERNKPVVKERIGDIYGTD